MSTFIYILRNFLWPLLSRICLFLSRNEEAIAMTHESEIVSNNTIAALETQLDQTRQDLVRKGSELQSVSVSLTTVKTEVLIFRSNYKKKCLLWYIYIYMCVCVFYCLARPRSDEASCCCWCTCPYLDFATRKNRWIKVYIYIYITTTTTTILLLLLLIPYLCVWW